MTTDCTPLNNPGQLLANLPAIFGFYPQESLVLAAFERLTDTRYRLGPVLRLDLTASAAFDSLARLSDGHIADFHADLVFAFIITRRLDPADIDSIAHHLAGLADAGALPIDACWTAPEVLTGERYEMIFGPDLPEHIDRGPAWLRGDIADIVAARSMQPWIEQGVLPELTRGDAAARFARLDAGEDGATELAELEAFACRLASWICDDSSDQHVELVGAAATDFQLLLGELDDTGATMAEVLDDANALLVGAVVMAETQLRDVTAVVVLDRAEAAATLMLALARRFTGAIRANALCLYALAMVRRGLPMVAPPALVAAQSEAPGHSLSALLLQACQHGLAEHVLSSVEMGSEDTRRALGLEGPDGGGEGECPARCA